MTVKINDKRDRLGFIGWIKARALERKLRRRWKNDPEWRARVFAGVQDGLKKHEFKFRKGGPAE